MPAFFSTAAVMTARLGFLGRPVVVTCGLGGRLLIVVSTKLDRFAFSACKPWIEEDFEGVLDALSDLDGRLEAALARKLGVDLGRDGPEGRADVGVGLVGRGWGGRRERDEGYRGFGATGSKCAGIAELCSVRGMCNEAHRR